MSPTVAPFGSEIRVYIDSATARRLYEEISGRQDFEAVYTDRSNHFHPEQDSLAVCIYPTNETHLGVNDLYVVQFHDGVVNAAQWTEDHGITPLTIEFTGWYEMALASMVHNDPSTDRRVSVINTVTGASHVLITARDFVSLDQLLYRVLLGSFAGFGEL